jgi:purine nucleosidase
LSARESSERPVRSLHIDTDPGLDDLLALGLALASPEVRVCGVTTVAGNARLDAVTENAARFLALAGVDVPLGRGARRPLHLPRATAEQIHGRDGRRGLPLPARADRPEASAEQVLRSGLETGSIDQVVALGPLTNLAELVLRAPKLLSAVEVVWMGGTLGRGNATPLAEFNAYADPHALAVLLEADVAMRVVSLDVTQLVVVRPAQLEAGAFGQEALGLFLERTLRALMEAERPSHGEALAPLHDPCALAAALSPDLFRWEERHLEVCAEDGRERGRLLERPAGATRNRPVLWAAEVLGEDIIQLFLGRLAAWRGGRADT